MPQRASEPLSRPVRELCPQLLSAVTQLCVRDEDLAALAVWMEPPAHCPIPPAVWSRFVLQRLLGEDEGAGRALAGRLDLRYASEVLETRGSAPEAVRERTDELLAGGDGGAVPGLLWAAATDPRPAVQRVAVRFAFVSNLAACRAFVDDPGCRAAGREPRRG